MRGGRRLKQIETGFETFQIDNGFYNGIMIYIFIYNREHITLVGLFRTCVFCRVSCSTRRFCIRSGRVFRVTHTVMLHWLFLLDIIMYIHIIISIINDILTFILFTK
jgi:hypothetical protein